MKMMVLYTLKEGSVLRFLQSSGSFFIRKINFVSGGLTSILLAFKFCIALRTKLENLVGFIPQVTLVAIVGVAVVA